MEPVEALAALSGGLLLTAVGFAAGGLFLVSAGGRLGFGHAAAKAFDEVLGGLVGGVVGIHLVEGVFEVHDLAVLLAPLAVGLAGVLALDLLQAFDVLGGAFAAGDLVAELAFG